MVTLAQRLANLSPGQRRQFQTGLSKIGTASAPRRTTSQSSYPLSFAQQRLWILNALQENDRTYLISGALRLTGSFDVVSFRSCIASIVSRHASLRTVFEDVGGEARQRVLAAEAVEVPCPVIDLSSVAADERTAQACARVEEEMRKPFDLAKGPLLRVLAIDMGESVEHGGREHIVVFTMHHIVSDGWSSETLLRDFAALYEAHLSGVPAQLPELPLQYVDYAVWQRDWLAGETLDRQMAYWREALAGAPFVLDLPTDRPRPPAPDNAGRTRRFEVPAELAGRLRTLSRASGATLYMTLLAAYFILLSRWTGARDICVGTPIANRRRVELEGLIGFFVNTLVMRGDLSDDPDFTTFLSRIRSFCLGAQEHQDLPFERLVEALAPMRDLSRTPLFQTMFSLQNAPARAFSLPGLAIEPYETESGTAKFDLSFELLEEPDGRLLGEAEYATALFDAATVERMAAHYLRLLESIAATPQARVSALEMLPAAERDLLVGGFNATRCAYPQDELLHELFAAQAARTPDAPALLHEGETLTYGELNAAANRLARLLIDRGAGPETIVAVCLERSFEMIVSLIAILKAGAAYLPIDPALPDERIAFIVGDAQPLLAIVCKAHQDRLPAKTARLLIDGADTAEHPPAQGDGPIASRASAENMAYVIYTSGSTGRPKGTVVSHASLANLARNQIAVHRLDRSDRVLQLASPSFDLSIEEILPTLCSGATLALSPHRFPETWSAFHSLIVDNGVTFLSAPTAVWRHYTRWLVETRTPAPPSLRALSTGTEAADVATLRLWRKAAPHVEWTNCYGPTEATVTATVYRPDDDLQTLAEIPVGRPLQNTQAHILDSRFEPAAIGVAGEICIGGAGVARGYLNRADLTAEKFVPDPFGPPGARLYRTGDKARRRADGDILFVGRMDDQVKIRGYRVEPGEIEAALVTLKDIRSAAVVAKGDTAEGQQLVAYISTESPDAFDVSAAKARLRTLLPDYMIPATIVARSELPLTQNGKIDRQRLNEIEVTSDNSAFVAPRSATEKTICRIWADALNLQRVSVTDNFFEIGGHSLLALRVVDAMRRNGLEVDARMIFTAPTPAEIARVANTRSSTVTPPNLIGQDCARITPDMITLAKLTQDDVDRLVAATPGGARNIEDIYPLAPLQEGILYHHLMASVGDTYLSPMQLAFASRARLDEFVDALRALVAQHDVLRTAVAYEGLTEPVQIVWRHAPLEVQELPPMKALEMRDRFDPAHYRIDLRKAPLFEIFAAQDPDDGRWLLLLLTHHLILDHATTESLLDQIRKRLSGQAIKKSGASYRDFVAQSRLGLSGAEHERFFSEMLADFNEPTIPLSLGNWRSNGSKTLTARLPLADALSVRLRGAARLLGVSPACIFHLAFARLLGRLSGKDDVVFGTVMFGRMNGATTDALGMFINTLPFRLRAGGLGAMQAVRKTQETLMALLEHEHASLSLAQNCSGVRQPAPLFTALLNFRHSADEGESVDGSFSLATGVDLIFAEERSNYPFDLSVDDFGDRFALEMQTVSGIDPESICSMMHTVVEGLVETLEQRPDQPFHEIDVLSDGEGRQLLDGFNETDVAFPSNGTVIELFTAQTRRNPEGIALSCKTQTITYDELDRRSNRLARVLIAHGAGPESIVGVCFERGMDMIVSLLAIHKAGAAYLPLDPDYPPERLAYMIEDARPGITVTSTLLQTRLPQIAPKLVTDHPAIDTQITSASGAPIDSRVKPQNLAYLIYTSGTTGQPKGAAISHANLANLTQGQIAFYGFGPGHRLLQLTSLNFDMSVEEIFPALCSGAALVLSPARLAGSWPAFHALIAENAVTFLNAPTSIWRHYTQWLAETGASPPASLKELSTGAEAVDVATLRLWRSRAPDANWTNGYGPTETTVDATAYRLNKGSPTSDEVPIGKPLANYRVYILDRRLEPAPIGVDGEIYIGGAGVARGYLGRPALTAERFIPDPHGPPGGRLYRTGDLARYAANGEIHFIGRVDHQVKIRGYRVELGEIESALSKLPGVRAAVVVAGSELNGDKALYGYVATEHPHAFDVESARAALRKALPDYMTPAAIVALETLPLGANGKVDRKALPDVGARRSQTGFVSPEGETERALSAAWSQTLGVERISALDNFFELGGHSLTVMQMAARLSRALSVEIPLPLIYQAETLRELASAIDAAALLRTKAKTSQEGEELEEFEL